MEQNGLRGRRIAVLAADGFALAAVAATVLGSPARARIPATRQLAGTAAG